MGTPRTPGIVVAQDDGLGRGHGSHALHQGHILLSKIAHKYGGIHIQRLQRLLVFFKPVAVDVSDDGQPDHAACAAKWAMLGAGWRGPAV